MDSPHYAVFHVTKYKQLGGIGHHIDRLGSDPPKREPGEDLHHLLGAHIDPDRTHLNEELVPHGGKSLSACVHVRIAEGYLLDKGIRKDAVKALGIMLAGSHERMKDIENDPALFDAWKKKNYKFSCDEFGKENIVRFTLHRDEKTPHIHCVVVPITPDGRLSAKEYIDGKIKLQSLQNRYAESMASFGLERGIEESLTGRKHEDVKVYYKQINEVGRAIAKETKHINSLNPFNRTKAIQEKEWLEMELRKVQMENKSTKKELIYAHSTSKTLINSQTNHDLDRIKKEVNLIQHVSSMGYTLNKHKSSKVWAVMEKDSDKLLIKNSTNQQGHWVYKSLVDDQDKGSIVDFMLKRNFSYQSIRGLSSSHLDTSVLKSQKDLSYEINDPDTQSHLARASLLKIAAKSKDNYLCARGIDPSTYSSYSSSMLKVGRQASFALYQSLDSHGKGTICSTLTYYFSDNKEMPGSIVSKKYFEKGLPRGLSVLQDAGIPVTKIVITESPIDSLSHKQLHQEPSSTMYVSTCGNLTSGIKKELTNLLQSAQINKQRVVLAFDHDAAGQSMAEQVRSLVKEAGSVHVETPKKGKDWNELLQDSLRTDHKEVLYKLCKDLSISGQEHQLGHAKEMNVLGLDIEL